MADGAEIVKMRLTFWHGTKKPGDTVEVRRDEMHSWHGFAVPVDDEPEPAKTDDTAAQKTTVKTSTAKQA